jgi:hypothetical protein
MRDYSATLMPLLPEPELRGTTPSPNQDVADVNAVVNVVIYSDCTAEVQAGGERAFKQFMAVRRGQLLAMQKINEVVKKGPGRSHGPKPCCDGEDGVDATPPCRNRQALCSRGLGGLSGMSLRSSQNDISNPHSERTYLQKYVEQTDKRIELTLPHTQISPMSAK